ncbi:MAG: DUF1697 domain-containing protein [Solirubrobacteraceae bacterium]|jgi:uncharacterized protein (DUF1697 family)
MTIQIALLRGVNIGSSRRVPMADLRALLASYGDVKTYLQSGNVVLESELAPGPLARELEARLAAAFGFAVPVIVRSCAQLADVVARDPFGALALDPKRYQVTFFENEPPPELEAKLVGAALPGERVQISGREIYASHPAGIARSDLAKLVADRRLGGTARNWTTVTALLELAGALGASGSRRQQGSSRSSR